MNARIIGLTAENVKRLKAVEITPDNHGKISDEVPQWVLTQDAIFDTLYSP